MAGGIGGHVGARPPSGPIPSYDPLLQPRGADSGVRLDPLLPAYRNVAEQEAHGLSGSAASGNEIDPSEQLALQQAMDRSNRLVWLSNLMKKLTDTMLRNTSRKD